MDDPDHHRAYTSDIEIERVALGLLDCSLPHAEWTHQAHFASAIWLRRHRPQLHLPSQLPGIIRAYNTANGVPNSDTQGYHETITLVSLRAIRSYLGWFPLTEKGSAAPIYQVVASLMNSFVGHDKLWPLKYWSHDVLFSATARREWVEPDLLPLPPAWVDLA
jgi:hypothetical protein